MSSGIVSDPAEPDSCTGCEVRRFICDLRKPTCGRCQRDGFTCDWDGVMGQHIFDMFPGDYNLNGQLLQNARELQIGRGSFGSVFRNRLASGGLVVVKIPHVKNSWKAPPKRALQLCVREALTWSRLHHPNIIPLRGVTSDPLPTVLCLVSDWMADGNIMDYLQERPETDRIYLLWGMSKAVHHLHRQRPPIVHGDLKGNNILISHQGEALLTDFGLSYIVDEAEGMTRNDTSTALQGNVRWMAPERLRPDIFDMTPQESRRPPSDVFSMLRTFLEVLTGHEPYHELPNYLAVLMMHVLESKHPLRPAGQAEGNGLNDALWNLMLQAWDRDRANRPTSAEVERFMRRAWNEEEDLPPPASSTGSPLQAQHAASPEESPSASMRSFTDSIMLPNLSNETTETSVHGANVPVPVRLRPSVQSPPNVFMNSTTEIVQRIPSERPRTPLSAPYPTSIANSLPSSLDEPPEGHQAMAPSPQRSESDPNQNIAPPIPPRIGYAYSAGSRSEIFGTKSLPPPLPPRPIVSFKRSDNRSPGLVTNTSTSVLFSSPVIPTPTSAVLSYDSSRPPPVSATQPSTPYPWTVAQLMSDAVDMTDVREAPPSIFPGDRDRYIEKSNWGAPFNVVALSGRRICVVLPNLASTSVQVWHVDSSLTEPVHEIALEKSSVIRGLFSTFSVTAMTFRPGVQAEDEGRYLWCGSSIGHLFELDIQAGLVTTERRTSPATKISHILRHDRSMFVIEETGKVQIFDSTEQVSSMKRTPRVVRIASKQLFAQVLGKDGQIWTSDGPGGGENGGAIDKTRGPNIKIYEVPLIKATSKFSVRIAWISEPIGAVTSGCVSPSRNDLVHLGHERGTISIWSRHEQEPSCVKTIRIDAVDITALEPVPLQGVASKLWIGNSQGMILAIDVDVWPWKVTNRWKGSKHAVYRIALDRQGISQFGRLLVISAGQTHIRLWDGTISGDYDPNTLSL